jgi:hypothetical protein
MLLVGAVSLIKGTVREAGPAIVEVCDLLEGKLNEIGFVANAPFKTVHLIVRLGEKNELKPKYQAINKRHMELPVTVEVELAPLRVAKRDEVVRTFMKATVAVLLDVARKYDLPSDGLSDLLPADTHA